MVKRSSGNNSLTESQAQIFEFIKERCEKTGVPPTYRDIQNHFGYKAIGTVQDHVKALLAKGWLEKNETGDRTARGLIPKGHRREEFRRIPIYGEIAAGSPREAEQLEFGSLVLGPEFSVRAQFALRVVGDSMIEAGIFEGDLIIVEKNRSVKNGDIVVALLDGETTVKRYEEKRGVIHLIPENKKLSPIAVTGKGERQFQIIGRVVGLQRVLS